MSACLPARPLQARHGARPLGRQPDQSCSCTSQSCGCTCHSYSHSCACLREQVEGEDEAGIRNRQPAAQRQRAAQRLLLRRVLEHAHRPRLVCVGGGGEACSGECVGALCCVAEGRRQQSSKAANKGGMPMRMSLRTPGSTTAATVLPSHRRVSPCPCAGGGTDALPRPAAAQHTAQHSTHLLPVSTPQSDSARATAGSQRAGCCGGGQGPGRGRAGVWDKRFVR